MWPFSKRPEKGAFQKFKRVKVGGMQFTIRKINPLLDFPGEQLPQIFVSAPQKKMPETVAEETTKRQIADMKMIVRAGVVDPPMSAAGKGEAFGRESWLTVDDLFRDPEMGLRLYIEVMAHSLNHFSGLKGVFFSIKLRHTLFIIWRKLMAAPQLMYCSPKADTAS